MKIKMLRTLCSIAVSALLLQISQLSGSEKVTGFNVGVLPAIGYNSDTGYSYGIAGSLYQYGTGRYYPDYLYSIYAEWSRTTKGGGINTLFFDSKYLLPWGIRITGNLNYLTEQALPFYGFNGYVTPYHASWEDNSVRTRVYYKHARIVKRLTLDFQKASGIHHLNIIAGIGLWNTDVSPVDIQELNKGRSESEKLPDVPGLYQTYLSQGYIAPGESKGGQVNYLKAGFVYDTRDNEANPSSGIWTALMFTQAAQSLGSEYQYTQMTVTHRQYFPIISPDLTFAGRLGYQAVLSGDIPFFMLPYYQTSYKVVEGLGGSKTIRGVLKNRVVGNAEMLLNLELRWKFYHDIIFGQHIYLALNTFLDGGQVLKNYGTPEYLNDYSSQHDHMHLAYGAGVRIAVNKNLIVGADLGLPVDPQDGDLGFYIVMDYMY